MKKKQISNEIEYLKNYIQTQQYLHNVRYGLIYFSMFVEAPYALIYSSMSKRIIYTLDKQAKYEGGYGSCKLKNLKVSLGYHYITGVM